MSVAQGRTLNAIGLEALSYDQAFRLQRRLIERVLESERRENFLVLAEHPPVITVGRSGDQAEILADAERLRERGVTVVETNRGGKATLHAPGQLVAYPVIDLKARGSDLHRYLRDLEQWLIRLLGSYGIAAGVNPPKTGVWVDGGKLASIGIAVRRWVGYHGVALNVSTDMTLFDLIVPCGLAGVRMVSMAELLGDGAAPGMAEVADRAAEMFAEDFGFGTLTRVSAGAAEEGAG